ncbi:hypothetical protein P3L10_010109 [Capsicum annuum]
MFFFGVNRKFVLYLLWVIFKLNPGVAIFMLFVSSLLESGKSFISALLFLLVLDWADFLCCESLRFIPMVLEVFGLCVSLPLFCRCYCILDVKKTDML